MTNIKHHMAFFSVMQVAAARLYFVFVNKTFNLHRRQRIVVISTLVASFFAQKNVIQNANLVMVFFSNDLHRLGKSSQDSLDLIRKYYFQDHAALWI